MIKQLRSYFEAGFEFYPALLALALTGREARILSNLRLVWNVWEQEAVDEMAADQYELTH